MSDDKIGAPGTTYLLKHTSHTVPAVLNEIVSTIDPNTLYDQNKAKAAKSLLFNEIAYVKLHLQRPIFGDTYSVNRSTGSFILIDNLSNQTVAGGIITDEPAVKGVIKKNASTKSGCVVWLTGLSGAGKTTIAYALKKQLKTLGRLAYVLDGDEIRRGLSRDLGFSPQDRTEHVRRVGEVASLFAHAGVIAVVALISPYKKDRDLARLAVVDEPFYEIFVDASIDTCESRDPKHLYKKVRPERSKILLGLAPPMSDRNPQISS